MGLENAVQAFAWLVDNIIEEQYKEAPLVGNKRWLACCRIISLFSDNLDSGSLLTACWNDPQDSSPQENTDIFWKC